MEERIRIAVDAMGGDNAPDVTVRGAVEALDMSEKISIILTGRTEAIQRELSKYVYDESRIEIVHAEDVIGFDEPPVMAIRKKKNSSIVVGMNLVKKGEADAFVSAGSTGAILVGGQFVVGRIKGIERAPLAPLIPTIEGSSRRKRGCQVIPSASVRADGFDLYETCKRRGKSKGCDCEYRRRGRKGEYVSKGDISFTKRMLRY